MPAIVAETGDSPSRKPRADAERNRLRLLDAAKSVFGEHGPGASLEEIARVAGVGIGTLYRHFPTRDALIEAVYRNETGQLMDAATRLSETRPPVEALREWMLLFVDYLGTKYGMSAVFSSIAGGTTALYAGSGTGVREAITTLTERAVASGEIRLEMEPLDLLRAVAGVASAGAGWQDTARRLVDILIAGMRT
ncbi:TetR/AcrR family transcriptional regulator [Sphingomonas sp. R-74633]|uniref:TetR/AcrR family transcriptional regulator n=1 Tax=Sphingomonas sp. R-74633 TaxID=2751188 RepID=UPI0015D3E61B|nr:TetR/AcrR family transcriptional regulator [Sphingomonas sp. R-74633]NYT40634.1 TetR/AcrR family transcriptional regulator [Sphingomonas sp. R-74633]